MKLRIILAVFIILMVCLVAAPEKAMGQGSAAWIFQPLDGETATFSDDGAGTMRVTVTAADASSLMTLDVVGLTVESSIRLIRTAASNYELEVAHAGLDFSLALVSLPAAAPVVLRFSADNRLEVTAADPSGERVGVGITITELGPRLGLSIMYDPLPEEFAGRITPLYPGLLEENALGGSVTLAASELTDDARVLIELSYLEEDAAGLNENSFRLLRFSNAEGRYVPVGENNRGIGQPSTAAGDFGVDVQNNIVWAVAGSLGSFVAGPPDPTLPSTIIDDADDNPMGGFTLCGPAAVMWSTLCLVGLTLTAGHGKRRG